MELTQDSYEANELQWQLYTKAGNQRMQANLYLEAQQAYNQAMKLAHLMLEEARSSTNHPEAIHPYVVSCHNLADCWLDLGNVTQAERILQQVFHQVVQVMNNIDVPDLLRLEAFKALKVVSFEIQGFYRNLDQLTQAEHIFEQGLTLAQEFLDQFAFSQIVNLEELLDHRPCQEI
jgi:tetratricopeptide (TPR) repeat protein